MTTTTGGVSQSPRRPLSGQVEQARHHTPQDPHTHGGHRQPVEEHHHHTRQDLRTHGGHRHAAEEPRLTLRPHRSTSDEPTYDSMRSPPQRPRHCQAEQPRRGQAGSAQQGQVGPRPRDLAMDRNRHWTDFCLRRILKQRLCMSGKPSK